MFAFKLNGRFCNIYADFKEVEIKVAHRGDILKWYYTEDQARLSLANYLNNPLYSVPDGTREIADELEIVQIDDDSANEYELTEAE